MNDEMKNRENLLDNARQIFRKEYEILEKTREIFEDETIAKAINCDWINPYAKSKKAF